MRDSLLLFVKRHYVRHLGYLFVEISNIKSLSVDDLREFAQLRGREFLRQQIEKQSPVVVSFTAYGFPGLLYNKVMVKSRRSYVIDPAPLCRAGSTVFSKALSSFTSAK